MEMEKGKWRTLLNIVTDVIIKASKQMLVAIIANVTHLFLPSTNQVKYFRRNGVKPFSATLEYK